MMVTKYIKTTTIVWHEIDLEVSDGEDNNDIMERAASFAKETDRAPIDGKDELKSMPIKSSYELEECSSSDAH